MATTNDENVSVLLGNGNGTFQAPNNIGLGLGSRPNSVAVGDFNGDGLLDLGVTSNVYNGFYEGYSGSANVLLGNGLGSFSGPNTTPLGWGYHTAAVAANLNGDVFDDFVTVKFYNDSVSVLLGAGTGYLQGPSNFSTGSAPLSVAAGDVNGDTVIDLVAANWLGNDVSVLLGDGLGSFSTAGNYATGLNPLAVVLGEAGCPVATSTLPSPVKSSELSVLYGGGDGTFSSAPGR